MYCASWTDNWSAKHVISFRSQAITKPWINIYNVYILNVNQILNPVTRSQFHSKWITLFTYWSRYNWIRYDTTRQHSLDVLDISNILMAAFVPMWNVEYWQLREPGWCVHKECTEKPNDNKQTNEQTSQLQICILIRFLAFSLSLTQLMCQSMRAGCVSFCDTTVYCSTYKCWDCVRKCVYVCVFFQT